MKKALIWLVVNSAFALTIYAALVLNIVGAQRIIIFISWWLAIVSISMFFEAPRKIIADHGRAVPSIVDNVFDVCVVAALIWYGYWATGSAYLFASVLFDSAYKSKKEEVK